YLASNHEVNHAIAQENNQIQYDQKLAGIPAKSVTGKNEGSIARDRTEGGNIGDTSGAYEGAKESAERSVTEGKTKDGGGQHPESNILGSQIDRQPKEEGLEIGAPGDRMAFVRKDATDATSFDVVFDECTLKVFEVRGKSGSRYVVPMMGIEVRGFIAFIFIKYSLVAQVRWPSFGIFYVG
ncbi:MAG: hypothetical protein Q9204_009382, partial [Flavoplaca sp. TL-2023a]